MDFFIQAPLKKEISEKIKANFKEEGAAGHEMIFTKAYFKGADASKIIL